ncbi:olfactory receptor 1L4-like [Gastrophryne carolinensis]
MDKTRNVTLTLILLGFSDLRINHVALFSVILVAYALTWIGNFLLLISIRLSPQLHTPMYFFLGNLSVVDISFSTVTIPKLLSVILRGATDFSFVACLLQVYFFVFLGTTETLTLAVMAIDRYLAICNPLRYSSVMNRKVQVMLTLSCWATANLHSLLYVYTMSQLKFCKERRIHHYFCDMAPLIKMSCSGGAHATLLLYTEGSAVTCTAFLLILTSYVLIARDIMKLNTTASRSKAFSSCSSHLMAVCLFYVSILVIYMRPSASYASQYDRLISMAYTVLTPMLNPFIYSLRNQDVRKTLQKLICDELYRHLSGSYGQPRLTPLVIVTVLTELDVRKYKVSSLQEKKTLVKRKGLRGSRKQHNGEKLPPVI